MLSNVLDNDEILDQSGCARRGKESRSGAMKPKLRTDIFNHKDIMLITLNSPNGKINLVNAYSDSNGSAIRILRDSDIPLLSYLGGDFNCPSRHWDESVIRSNPLANSLFEFAEEHGLDFRTGGIGATHYPRNRSRPSRRFLFLYHHVHSHLVPAHRFHRLITR